MKEEALEKLPEVRDELEAAVEEILAAEPDGVRTRKMMYRIYDHPCDVNPSPKYIYVWMAELKRDGIVVIDRPNKRYLHPTYADKEPEAYPQQYDWPPSDLGSKGE